MIEVLVKQVEKLETDSESLWISCHGYESRSCQHLDKNLSEGDFRKFSYGFDFPKPGDNPVVDQRLEEHETRLRTAGFATQVCNDFDFDQEVARLINEHNPSGSCCGY